MNEQAPEALPLDEVEQNDSESLVDADTGIPAEPGSQPEDLMEFEAADDAPPDSEMPENDQELGDAELQETEEEDDV